MAELNVTVVCAANLSASPKCPSNCGKCWYGGRIPVHWMFRDQGFVQFYSSGEAISQEYDALQYDYAHNTFAEKEKFVALKEWLLSHKAKGENLQ